MDYAMVSTTPVGENQRPTAPGAINGGMMKREGIFQTPVLVIDVPDVNAAAARVTAAGGQVVKDPFPVGDMGIAAYFRDPEGNVLGLGSLSGAEPHGAVVGSRTTSSLLPARPAAP